MLHIYSYRLTYSYIYIYICDTGELRAYVCVCVFACSSGPHYGPCISTCWIWWVVCAQETEAKQAAKMTPTLGVKMSGWKPLVVGISRWGDGMGMAFRNWWYPIAGWCMSWTNPNLKWMKNGGYPHFRNPPYVGIVGHPFFGWSLELLAESGELLLARNFAEQSLALGQQVPVMGARVFVRSDFMLLCYNKIL